MRFLVGRPRRTRSALVLSLALVAVLVATIPAAAFNAAWTTPKRVFAYDGAPTYSMVVDANGKTHIATERGSTGIWYVTNASGSWQQCQLSEGNDREPSIATANGVTHIAFARRNDGERGIYTASTNISTSTSDCGLAITQRFAGSASYPSMAFYGGKLSIAFRTASKKLKFIKGVLAENPWTIDETIDGKCCTSAPSLALTTNGSPRVAYGDGTSKAQGLKYAVRTSSGWKKSKASGGRIKQVSMVLDKTPGPIKPASNAPKIVYVVKKKGTYLGTKTTTFASGKWGKRWFGRNWTPPDVIFSSNVTQLVYGSRGNLYYVRLSGGIWLPTTLSKTGYDVKPQIDGAVITFSRKKGNKGIYYARKR